MGKGKNILLTGAAGFIGSYLLGFLNQKGYENIILVDEFVDENKKPNYEQKRFIQMVEREYLFDWLQKTNPSIDFVFHLGARTDTTEFDYSVHEKLNVQYSRRIWNYCSEKNIPLVYASSAATYGAGEFGYRDDHDVASLLKPLNPYGRSKNEFDKWLLQQTTQNQAGKINPFWAGLKFFNVYGPNEYHKGRMASMVYHGFHQVRETGRIKLFKSHRPEFKDGGQVRDFIYVEDVAKVCYWLMQHSITSGLYNIGTGLARSFNDLAQAIFKTMEKDPLIDYIDMPDDLRVTYQYFTEADMNKLRAAGYSDSFCSLETGVEDYIKNYLVPCRWY